MKKVMNIIFAVVAAAGFLLMLGVAGNDCDGKCMENALPIGELIMYALAGLAMMAVGVMGLIGNNPE